MKWKKSYWLFLLILLIGFGGLWLFGQYEETILHTLKSELGRWQGMYEAHPFLVILGYALFYILVVAFLIPADVVMMLLGGALFGMFCGSLISCTAHTIGATVNFIASRYIFKRVETGPAPAIATGKNAWFYLLLLRLTPLVPAHGISLMMGATSLGVLGFFVGTWFGSIPMSILFAFFGTHLHLLENPAELVTPGMIAGLIALILLLICAKKFGDRYWAAKTAGEAS